MVRTVFSFLLVACASCGDADEHAAPSASASESAAASAGANEDAPVAIATAAAAAAPEVWAPGSVCTPNDVAILGASTSSASSSGSAIVRLGATSVSGRLPPEVIQRIVRSIRGKLRSCYEAGLASNPNLAGRVNVSFVIGRDGSVGSVSGGGDIPDPSVISCVSKAFYGLTFPQPEGGVVKVSYPVAFSPGP